LEGNQLLFVCNKIDHVEENLRRDFDPNGKLDVREDGSAVYTVEDLEIRLQDKAEATFESLKHFGFVPDTDTAYLSANYLSVSAKMSKASRTSENPIQYKYYDHQYERLTNHLSCRLDKILIQHTLGVVRSANAVILRFAQGALVTRTAELESDLRMEKILTQAGQAEQDAYSRCVEFLLEEVKSIEEAVRVSFSTAKPIIVQNAKKMTAKEVVTDIKDDSLAQAFLVAIANMAFRVLHKEIVSRIDDIKQKYVKEFSFFMQVIVGGCDVTLDDLFRCIFQPRNAAGVIETLRDPQTSDKVVEAGLALFFFIPEAVKWAIKEVFPENPVNSKIFAKLAGASLKIVKLDEKWKEAIAEEFLTMIEVEKLAPAILKHCHQKLEEKHKLYVHSHQQMITLRKAKSSRTREDNLRLRIQFKLRIALLLLRLYAMQCALEKGEPEEGDLIEKGHHCSVFACPGWGSPKPPNTVVIKKFIFLSQELWGEVARSFFLLRSLQGNDETDNHTVKLHGALISPLGEKEAEQQLILVMERRATTLNEALRRGLSRDERKSIARDVAEALFFFHRESDFYGDLTSDSVSLDGNNRAKLDVMKVRPRDKDSWLGCPAFHQAPEVILDEHEANSDSDIYSFGVLLWEIFNESQEPPACYADCKNKEDMKKKVCDEGLRPNKPDHLEDEWYRIMEKCWTEPKHRPCMGDLTSEIRDLLASNQGEEVHSSN
jgi:RNA binding exosome subunit